MTFVFLVLILILIVFLSSKSLQRFLLIKLIQWVSSKLVKKQEGYSNNFNNSDKEANTDSHKESQRSNGKMSESDMYKKKFEEKRNDQYIDFEEIK